MPTTLFRRWEDAKRDCWVITSRRTASDLLPLTQGRFGDSSKLPRRFVRRLRTEAPGFLR